MEEVIELEPLEISYIQPQAEKPLPSTWLTSHRWTAIPKNCLTPFVVLSALHIN